MKFALLALFAFTASAQAMSLDELSSETDFTTPACSVDQSLSGSTDIKTFFAIGFDQEPLVKIDGVKYDLKLAMGQVDLWQINKDAGTVSTKYEGNGVTVELKGIQASVCEEECEYTEMKFESMTVTKGKESVTIKDLTGGCGV